MLVLACIVALLASTESNIVTAYDASSTEVTTTRHVTSTTWRDEENYTRTRSDSVTTGRSDSGTTDRSDSGTTDRSNSGTTDRSDSGTTHGGDSGTTDRSDSGSTDRSVSGTTDRSDSGITDRNDSGTTDRSDVAFTPIIANKTSDEREFWRQVAKAYFDFCGRSCEDKVADQEPYSRCHPCFCDDACFAYGDCCPDVYTHAGHGPSDDELSSRIHCIPSSFGSQSHGRFHKMVDKCPLEADDDLVRMCECDLQGHWNFTQPVTDPSTSLTYKNRYCAECNSATRVVPWQLTVTGKTSAMNDLVTMPAEELYHAALSGVTPLTVSYNPPDDVSHSARPCQMGVVDSCNVTGMWTVYDGEVETACTSFTATITPYFTVYKNPFCYLCNDRRPWHMLLTLKPGPGEAETPKSVSLMILLQFTDDDTDMTNPVCGDDQFFDVYTTSCRKATCAPGKELRNTYNGFTCQSKQKTSNLFGYQVCLRGNVQAERFQHLMPNISSTFSDLQLDVITVDIHDFFSNTSNSSDSLRRYLYVLRVFSPNPFERDAKDEEIITNMTRILRKINDLWNSSSELQFAQTCEPIVFNDLILVNASDETIVYSQRFLFQGGQFFMNFLGIAYVPFSRLMSCPGVRLNSSEFVFDGDMEKLYLTFSEKNVSFPYFYFPDSESPIICLDTYLDGYEDAGRKRNDVLYIVALVSTLLSLVFLLVSFLIYCLLPSLRSIAGINNMVLIVALFWAQIFLQVATDVALADWLCQVVGVATHFLWLCVVFAQNTCTFHMFYTLSFPLRSHAANTEVRAMVTRYVIYILTASSLLVMAVLVWQFPAEGQSGYGGQACFLRKASVRITTFMTPLALTVLLNVVMFTVTIFRLRSQTHISSTKSKKINLVLYTKLSVFTGVTWLFGFLASALDSVSLQYVFVVLQGCQGLFVFLAFLANGRVLGMLRELRTGRRGSSTGSHGHTHTRAHTYESGTRHPLHSTTATTTTTSTTTTTNGADQSAMQHYKDDSTAPETRPHNRTDNSDKTVSSSSVLLSWRL